MAICEAIRVEKVATAAEIGAVLRAGRRAPDGGVIWWPRSTADNPGTQEPGARSLRTASGCRRRHRLALPLVQILDLEDTSVCEVWIDQLVAGSFQDVIWLTGEGLRLLLSFAEQSGHRPPFVEALRGVRTITRGPKPARVLRELGLAPISQR
ncbi:MAG TPA: uroporphyrinogen-III synthase [Methylocella sp.]|nr:uroporphyrinogen-III synthase [Methylocella sp.]